MTTLINKERIGAIKRQLICIDCIKAGRSRESSKHCLITEHDRIEFIETTQIDIIMAEHGEELSKDEFIAAKAALLHCESLLESRHDTNTKHIIRVLQRLESGRYG